MLDNTRISEYKVKFRVYQTKRHDRCRKIHPVPQHRVIFHQGEGTEQEVAQQGHQIIVEQLKQEDAKNDTYTRPLFQYTLELGQ
jgi:hypothetical protein